MRWRLSQDCDKLAQLSGHARAGNITTRELGRIEGLGIMTPYHQMPGKRLPVCNIDLLNLLQNVENLLHGRSFNFFNCTVVIP